MTAVWKGDRRVNGVQGGQDYAETTHRDMRRDNCEPPREHNRSSQVLHAISCFLAGKETQRYN